MEGDAGTGQLNRTEPDGTDQVSDPSVSDAALRGPSRLRGRWLIGSVAVLVVLAVAIATGGYFALRSHQASQAAARDGAAAVAAAKECMLALNAPDPGAMAESQRKIVDCATGSFAVQAPRLSTLLVEAYAAANVHVQLLDMRAAVERNNDDGSVDVLTVLRLAVSSTGKEVSYRLRVTMQRDDGQYKVAKIDQVAR